LFTMHVTPVIELNCDLGEGEPRAHTASLMAMVHAANIACGGHAGDDVSIWNCLQSARQHRVRVGAHPGLPQRNSFGRDPAASLDPDALTDLLSDQVERVRRLAQAAGLSLSHVKLHGALYHLADRDEHLAHAYLDHAARSWPGLIVFARPGGMVHALAPDHGVEIWPEGFLDRGYADDGTLTPRGQPGALLSQPAAVARRIRDLRARGAWRSVTGKWVHLTVRTLCVHADTPNVLAVLRAARSELDVRGACTIGGERN
jgi:UPF0271 protein